MSARTPEERSLSARIAAAERWGRTADPKAATAPARAGLRARFVREADPDGTLDPADRERRADHLMRAHMLRMSLRAKAARRRAREQLDAAETADRELEAARRAAGEVA